MVGKRSRRGWTGSLVCTEPSSVALANLTVSPSRAEVRPKNGMSVTVSVQDDPGLRVDEQVVEAVPPDAVEFTVRGTVTVPGSLLGEFEGRRLRPIALEVSADGSPVTVELSGATTLELEAVDVGVEVPDAEDLPPGRDAGELPSRSDDLAPSKDDVNDLAGDVRDGGQPTGTDGAPELDAGVVAFTVTGTIAGLASETFEAIAAGPETIESVSFAVEDPRATDGGSGDDVLLDVGLLGFRLVIRRDGTITVAAG